MTDLEKQYLEQRHLNDALTRDNINLQLSILALEDELKIMTAVAERRALPAQRVN